MSNEEDEWNVLVSPSSDTANYSENVIGVRENTYSTSFNFCKQLSPISYTYSSSRLIKTLILIVWISIGILFYSLYDLYNCLLRLTFSSRTE